MSLKWWRPLVVAVVTLAILALAAMGNGAGATVRGAVPAPQVQANQMAVSPTLAAAALNRLSNQVDGRSARAMTNVHFILNWLPNVEFAGLWIAEQYGWFKKAGLHMTFTGWSPSVYPETQVQERGGNTFGFQSSAALAIARSKGVPDRALYADTQKSVFGLSVLASSKIYKITDLKGKRVGYQGHELYVPATMLSYAGLKPSDWKPVVVGFDPAQLTSGAVDAYLVFITNEPIALKLQGVGTRTFKAADYGFHAYDDVMFTYDGLISKNPALVRRVVAQVAQGFKFAHSHPDVSARLTVKNYFPASAAGTGTSAAKNLQQQILELRTFTPFSRDSRGGFSGTMNASVWGALINTLYKYGEIKSKPAATSMFTNQFNPYR